MAEPKIIVVEVSDSFGGLNEFAIGHLRGITKTQRANLRAHLKSGGKARVLNKITGETASLTLNPGEIFNTQKAPRLSTGT